MERQKQSDVNQEQWNKVKLNPKPVKGLRKIKARNMLKAIESDLYKLGNHEVHYAENVFTFVYRGTCIFEWHVLTDQRHEMDAGPYETSMATINQRREINSAIDNFKEVYGL